MDFESLDLNDDILDALYDMRSSNAHLVQEKCIPEILKGKDILGVAQTGTGKTAAYLLPVLSKLADGGYPEDAINCLIMSPTRELAQQIDQPPRLFILSEWCFVRCCLWRKRRKPLRPRD